MLGVVDRLVDIGILYLNLRFTVRPLERAKPLEVVRKIPAQIVDAVRHHVRHCPSHVAANPAFWTAPKVSAAESKPSLPPAIAHQFKNEPVPAAGSLIFPNLEWRGAPSNENSPVRELDTIKLHAHPKARPIAALRYPLRPERGITAIVLRRVANSGRLKRF